MKYLSMVFGMLSCGYRSLIKHWDSQVHTDYMYSFLHPISHRGSARMSFLNVGTTFNQSKIFKLQNRALIRTKTTMMMGFNERFLSCTENRKHQRRLGIQSHKMAAHEL
nr:uncharacterized protein LOC109619842 [Crassostrea gigas]